MPVSFDVNLLENTWTNPSIFVSGPKNLKAAATGTTSKPDIAPLKAECIRCFALGGLFPCSIDVSKSTCASCIPFKVCVPNTKPHPDATPASHIDRSWPMVDSIIWLTVGGCPGVLGSMRPTSSLAACAMYCGDKSIMSFKACAPLNTQSALLSLGLR